MSYLDSTGLSRVWAKIKAWMNTKQDALTAGDNITIDDGVISATGGTEVNVVSPLYSENSPAWGTNTSSVAVGPGAVAGGGNDTVVGAAACSGSTWAVVLGYGSRGAGRSTVSVGSGDTADDYGTRRIANVGDPVNDTDAATKAYVDSHSSDYELPAATSTTLGGVKVGSGLAIADGVLSATSTGGITGTYADGVLTLEV